MVIVDLNRLKQNKGRRKQTELPKLDDDDPKLSRTTLFVSTIPYAATNDDLEKFFSAVGPVRSCFVVRDSPGPDGEFRNKGYGLVCYSFRDDALKAREILRKKLFMGVRRLKISLALKKNERTLLERRINRIQDDRESRSEETSSYNSTIFLRELEETQDIRHLSNVFSPMGIVIQVRRPINFSNPSTAKIVIRNLDKTLFLKSAILPKVLRGDKLTALLARVKAEDTQSVTPEKVIIENIPFTTSFHELCELIASRHAIQEITLPYNSKTNQSHGFAFVAFLSSEIAAQVVTESLKEGIKLSNRTLRIKLLESPENYVKSKTSNSKKKFAESKDPLEGDNAALVAEQRHPENEKRSKSGSKCDTFYEGCTIFVRNLPYNVTDPDLRATFEQWGRVRFAQVTLDKKLNRAAGSGFICYYLKSDAEKCLSEYDTAVKELALTGIQPNHSRLISPGIPQNFTKSAMFTQSGRFLQVLPAVPKSQIAAIEATRSKESRNLYLLMEGVVFSDSPASNFLTKKELDTRIESYNSRKKLLAKNNYLFISKTRVSVRNLHKNVSEPVLKRSAISSVKLFWEEVQRGVRSGLEQSILLELPAAQNPRRTPPIVQVKIVRQKIEGKLKKSELPSKGYGFIQFKFHCDALAFLRYANNNPFAIKPNSKNTPQPSSTSPAEILSMSKPIVEFAIENTKILAKRTARIKTLNSKVGTSTASNHAS